MRIRNNKLHTHTAQKKKNYCLAKNPSSHKKSDDEETTNY